MTEILKSFEKAKTLKGKPNAFGKANVIRFREEKEAFVDAFESKLASNYQSEKEDVCIIACGPMVAEAIAGSLYLERGI